MVDSIRTLVNTNIRVVDHIGISPGLATISIRLSKDYFVSQPVQILVDAATVGRGTVPVRRRQAGTEDEQFHPFRLLVARRVCGCCHATRPRVDRCSNASSAWSRASCERSHSTNSAMPQRKPARALYSSFCEISEVSAKQWRISPARYLPVMAEGVLTPSMDDMTAASSRMVICVPDPVFTANPSA